MLTRRQFGSRLSVAFAAGAMVRPAGAALAQTGPWPEDLLHRFVEIEVRCGGRLGVGILDTQSGRTAGYRGDERFPMCSTHKALSAAAVLAQVDRGKDRLDRRVHFSAGQVLPYSPVTKAHAGNEGLTLAAICEAAVTLSDNTAANLMLDAIGGPAGFAAYLRGLGDVVTRLDRTEPTLNEALPGDPRDTTSPLAMAAEPEPARPWRGSLGRLARAVGGVAYCRQDRGCAPARRLSTRLARRGEDGHWRPRHRERRRRPLDAAAQARDRHGLHHGLEHDAGGAERRDSRRCAGDRVGAASLNARSALPFPSNGKRSFQEAEMDWCG